MDRWAEAAFHEFVATRSVALQRAAYLLVGDHGRAEDLVQTALIKTYLAWRRIRDAGALEGYVRRTMVNTASSWWRGRPYREQPVDRPPPYDDGDERLVRDEMWRHLLALPIKQRAVLVLRYYEGLSEVEIAETLVRPRGPPGADRPQPGTDRSRPGRISPQRKVHCGFSTRSRLTPPTGRRLR